jgi:heterodisulfide reductase subunit D
MEGTTRGRADPLALDVRYADELDTCLRCGYCRTFCPTWREVGWESASPRGKAFWLRRIARQTPMDRALGLTAEPTDRFLKHFYYCTMCGMCAEVCHTSIPLHHVWEANREALLRSGWGPLEGHASMLDSLARNNNPWGQPHSGRTEWMKGRELPATADVLWFQGCSESYTQFASAEAGIRWTSLGVDEWCCGNAEVKIGYTEHLDERARHNVDAIEATGATRVVTGCPGCMLNLGPVYRSRGMAGSYEVLHILELMAELLDQGRLEPVKRPRGKVIWHDPCELGRVGPRLYETPRRILDAVLGEGKWLEFPQNRDLQSCCGGGGGFKAIDDDAAVRIGARKVEEAHELGAAVIVTACPTCRFNFNHAIQHVKRKRRGDNDGEGAEDGTDSDDDKGGDRSGDGKAFKMRVMDIKELLARSL